MNKDFKNIAMVDIVYELIKENKGPMTIQDIFAEIVKIKDISLEDVEVLTTLYMNITTSGKFVFAGNDLWDLKEGNLELWDNDGSQFIEIIEEEEEEDEVFILDDEDEEELVIEDEEALEDLDEETKKEILEEKEYIAVELPLQSSDEDDEIEFDADDYDEDDYHDIMDDYEDMYDE